jgi:hypothetical protein
MSFDNFEKVCNDFISLRTNETLKMLENTCSNYMVLVDILFIFQKNLTIKYFKYQITFKKISKIKCIEKNEIDMLRVHGLLTERKQSIDQKYHSLIKDFEKYIFIPSSRDEAIRNLFIKLSKVALYLPEFNADDLRLKTERIIPDVIFF